MVTVGLCDELLQMKVITIDTSNIVIDVSLIEGREHNWGVIANLTKPFSTSSPSCRGTVKRMRSEPKD